MNFRSPKVLTVIGVGATRVVTTAVVVVLLRFGGGEKAVSDNAALIGGLIALGGVFTTQLVNISLEDRRAEQARKAERTQRRRDRKAEQAQRDRELQLAQQRSQDEALQAYLDQMGELLTDQALLSRTNWLDEARVTARARSLAVLQRLDGERKRSVLQFLYEARLINRWPSTLVGEETQELGPDGPAQYVARIVGLDGADLTNADLRYLLLESAALDGAILENADLRGASLRNSTLGGAYLSGADLSDADLRDASLVNAQLQRKDELNLSGANLIGADLSDADLSGANLYEAKGWTEGQLSAAKSLEGATMPNGQKYEDWLKEKEGHGDEEENSGSS